MRATKEECKAKYEGQRYKFNNGDTNLYMVVKEFRSHSDVDIEIEGTGIVMKTYMNRVKVGGVKNPFKTPNAAIAFSDPVYEYVGKVFYTNGGDQIMVLDYQNYTHVYYQFLDEYGYIGCTTLQNIKKGQLLNPYKRNQFHGYFGEDYGTLRGKYDNIYNIWHVLLIRAYPENKEYYKKYHDTDAYDNTDMDPAWLNYSNFAHWYIDRMNELSPDALAKYDYVIEKDILYPYYKHKTNGMKYYSPDTCVLVPQSLNVFMESQSIDILNLVPGTLNRFHGVKTIADSYYAEKAISDVVYEAIMGY